MTKIKIIQLKCILFHIYFTLNLFNCIIYVVNLMKEYISKSELETEEIAYEFAKTLSDDSIIVLNGELGTGKTKFVYGLAKYFNICNLVCSPTFTIVNEYPVASSKTVNKIFHFDVYRLTGPDDFIDSIGTEYFEKGLCIIEWGNIIEEILPNKTIYIDISYLASNDNYRKITIYKKGDVINK